MFRPGWSRFATLMLAAIVALAGVSANLSPALVSEARAAAGFLSIAEDVPLMPGLAENADAATVFDKPTGRIGSTEAKGNVTQAAVKQFYAATLPQLGWQAAGADLYRRDAERLRLGFAGRDGALTVRFELLPQ